MLWADGGFGKTSLAQWVYWQAQVRQFSALWVNLGLEKTRVFNSFARAVAGEMNYLLPEKASDEDLLRELCLRLAKTPCLLVLDQFESIEQTKNEPSFCNFLRAWNQLAQTSRVRGAVLVTTRQQVPDLNPAVYVKLKGFTLAEGAKFLGRSDHAIADSAEVRSLVMLADGHPKLLEMAAGWLYRMQRSTVDDSALEFFEKLFANYQGDPVAKVEQIFVVLFKPLAKPLKLLLLRCVVYRESFDLPMAQVMLPDIEQAVTETELEQLLSYGFLSRKEEGWQFHPLMTSLVTQASRKLQQLRVGHQYAVEYFKGQSQPWNGTLESCGAEFEMFHHFCELGQYGLAAAIMGTCVELLEGQGYYQVLLPEYERLTRQWSQQPELDAEEQEKLGWAWTNLGALRLSLAKVAEAIEGFEQAHQIFQKLQCRKGEASSLGNLGGSVYGFV